tara:strand:+ start:143 stop:547 length:405 start_codon:yes stop_codon:yes gene_type:complete
MKIEVSNGEILDKLTILYLKVAFIKDKDKLVNVRKEVEELRPIAQDLFQEYGEELRKLYDKLGEVNHRLWKIEDNIRECERSQDFSNEFIKLARAVYFTNDERSDIKKQINILTKSGLIEEKSYEDYDNIRREQ